MKNNEFDFGEAKRKRDEGMELASGSPRAINWNIDAGRWFMSLPEGTVFTLDDLTRAVGLPDEGANRNNAVGAFINGLARAKFIIWTGKMVKSERIDRHAGESKVWLKVR